MKGILDVLAQLRNKLGKKVYILIAVIGYTITFSAVEIALFRSFTTYTWDLGIFNQSFWNTLHGRFLYYTPETGIYTTSGSLLATHFMPVVLLALPFYALFPFPEALLVISTFVVALGSFPVYGIAKILLKDEKIAAILGITYLFYVPLEGLTLSGFSAESFAATIFLFLIYFLLKPDFRLLIPAVALGLLSHEAAVPIIAFIGIYGAIHYRSFKSKGFKVSLAIIAVSVPYFFIAQNLRVFFGWNQSPSLWNEWGLMGANSALEIPLRILTNPIGALNSLSFDAYAKFVYVIFLLLPLAFLPLLGLRGIIPSLPFLSVGLISSYSIYYSNGGHYAAFVAPFFFIGLIYALARIKNVRRLQKYLGRLVWTIVLISVISLTILFPLVSSQYQSVNADVNHNEIVARFLSLIPRNASVLTQNNIFPHVSDRPDAYTIASPSWGQSYEIADKQILKSLSELKLEYVLLDFGSSDAYAVRGASLIYTDFLLPNWQSYGIIASKDGVVLFFLNG